EYGRGIEDYQRDFRAFEGILWNRSRDDSIGTRKFREDSGTRPLSQTPSPGISCQDFLNLIIARRGIMIVGNIAITSAVAISRAIAMRGIGRRLFPKKISGNANMSGIAYRQDLRDQFSLQSK